LWVAATLTLYTGYDYLRAGTRSMVAAPRERAAPRAPHTKAAE
jgi:hypothetical protein